MKLKVMSATDNSASLHLQFNEAFLPHAPMLC